MHASLVLPPLHSVVYDYRSLSCQNTKAPERTTIHTRNKNRAQLSFAVYFLFPQVLDRYNSSSNASEFFLGGRLHRNLFLSWVSPSTIYRSHSRPTVRFDPRRTSLGSAIRHSGRVNLLVVFLLILHSLGDCILCKPLSGSLHLPAACRVFNVKRRQEMYVSRTQISSKG